MSLYVLYFEWSGDEAAREDAARDLGAADYEAARVQAAILYAGSTFMKAPPDGFRIVDGAGTVVYRYPEVTAH